MTGSFTFTPNQYILFMRSDILMDYKTVANNLVNYRKDKNLTQMELAEQINYSDKVISKWERGESLPGIDALKTIADFYKISVDDLIQEESKRLKNPISQKIELK